MGKRGSAVSLVPGSVVNHPRSTRPSPSESIETHENGDTSANRHNGQHVHVSPGQCLVCRGNARQRYSQRSPPNPYFVKLELTPVSPSSRLSPSSEHSLIQEQLVRSLSVKNKCGSFIISLKTTTMPSSKPLSETSESRLRKPSSPKSE